MSDESARRKAWHSHLKEDKQDNRRWWNAYCFRCGYKRKHHGEYHIRWGSDGPAPGIKRRRACTEFKGAPDE